MVKNRRERDSAARKRRERFTRRPEYAGGLLISESAEHAVMALDSKSIRRDFPIFHRWEGKNPLIYLDNAATSQKPRAVIDALINYYERCNSNIHRVVCRTERSATEH